MEVKVLEIQDTGCFIPVLAVDMNPSKDGDDNIDAQTYLLRRCGYQCDHVPNILLTRLDGSGDATNNPYAWRGARTFGIAHRWIIAYWHDLQDGSVVDVRFILGEAPKPAVSERYSERNA